MTTGGGIERDVYRQQRVRRTLGQQRKKARYTHAKNTVMNRIANIRLKELFSGFDSINGSFKVS